MDDLGNYVSNLLGFHGREDSADSQELLTSEPVRSGNPVFGEGARTVHPSLKAGFFIVEYRHSLCLHNWWMSLHYKYEHTVY